MSKLLYLFLSLLFVLILGGCAKLTPMPPPTELEASPIATPSSFDEALQYMNSQSAEERVLGMWAVINYPDDSSKALPLIVNNLYYSEDSNVRSAAARVLGELGALSKLAVPDLLKVMQSDSSLDVQTDIAIALGKIGDPSAIPALVDNLYDDQKSSLAAFSAKSISQLSGETFPDSGTNGFRLNEQGIPLIVLAAQEWWQQDGQFQSWTGK